MVEQSLERRDGLACCCPDAADDHLIARVVPKLLGAMSVDQAWARQWGVGVGTTEPLIVEKHQIEQIVLDAIDAANMAREDDDQLTVAPDAPLFGKGGRLDSMGLVALIVDVEEALADQGAHVTVTDERAMSMSKSPFKDVPSLVAHIEQILSE